MLGIEWPSESKLQRLREEGRVPCSSFGSSCLLLVILLLCAPESGAIWQRMITVWRGVWLSPAQGAGALLKQLAGAGVDLARILVVPVSLAALVYLLAGLAQTRFLLRPGLVGFGQGRFNMSGLRGLPGRVLGAFLVWGLSLLIGLGILRAALPSLLMLFDPKAGDLSSWLMDFCSKATPALLMVLGPVTLAAVIAARFLFLYRHRMTPAEIKLEERQGE